jgi:hypothetical protein
MDSAVAARRFGCLSVLLTFAIFVWSSILPDFTLVTHKEICWPQGAQHQDPGSKWRTPPKLRAASLRLVRKLTKPVASALMDRHRAAQSLEETFAKSVAGDIVIDIMSFNTPRRCPCTADSANTQFSGFFLDQPCDRHTRLSRWFD